MAYYAVNISDTLTHSGIPGQKWGVRRAEWYPIDKYKEHLQNLGYSNRQIKKKMKKAIKGEEKYQKSVAKTRAKNIEKAKQARKTSLENKKEREEIIKKGDINKAVKRIDDFSTEELMAIKNRNEAKQAIYEAKTKAAINKMGTVADATLKAYNIASNSVNIYNTIAKIANTFGDSNLPIIRDNYNPNKGNNSKGEATKNTNQNNPNTSKNKKDKFIDGAVKENVKSATSQGTSKYLVDDYKTKIRNSSVPSSMSDKVSKYLETSSSVGKSFSNGLLSESEYKEVMNYLSDKYDIGDKYR